MIALNEYIAALNQHRQRLLPCTAPPEFSADLLYGAALFNRYLDQRDTLSHDPNNGYAELCGTLYNARSRAPRDLAQYILKQLQASPAHEAIQTDPDLRVAAVSATTKAFVVRLSSTPVPHNAQEYTRYRCLP
ncbi:hypothetical protein F0P96_06270 [Hymenobacter busanensis]|uniref:Uncharacterized protein n=1 Tax=Hymenobacter busanensis TaxID=2607656 RepID=A0A7L5A031_9BACT|nr:hypothetical protein [Hymenobacter busanensis]KAA9338434.1 hypothetical protein F0P96_06270 [Hymenobacter busanensis]QHJ09139.1 hypothetical protein GUY19_18335 [Hymenobacter busanensis]